MSAHRRIPHPIRRLGYRVGRRGTFLLFLAMLDTVYGLGLTGHLARQSVSYRFADQFLPLEVWAVVWLAVGMVCLLSAPCARDQVAFGLAVLLKIFWGGLSLIGWLFEDVQRGYVSAVIWLAFAAVVFLISGWTENWVRNGDRHEGMQGGRR